MLALLKTDVKVIIVLLKIEIRRTLVARGCTAKGHIVEERQKEKEREREREIKKETD